MAVLQVTPVHEKSYAMFGSLPGTWIPFGLIIGATYVTERLAKQKSPRHLPSTWDLVQSHVRLASRLPKLVILISRLHFLSHEFLPDAYHSFVCACSLQAISHRA